MHRIRDPRDAVPSRGCRGRGRPLPPAAQANRFDKSTMELGSKGRSPWPGVQGARPPFPPRRAGDRPLLNDNLVIRALRCLHSFVISLIDTHTRAAHTSPPASYHALLPHFSHTSLAYKKKL